MLNFSMRWRLMKTYFSQHCPEKYGCNRSLARLKEQERAIWQRRFWEHQIRDERDFEPHVDDVHDNPVSHQLIDAPYNWPYSSFHRYVERGIYLNNWGADKETVFQETVGWE